MHVGVEGGGQRKGGVGGVGEGRGENQLLMCMCCKNPTRAAPATPDPPSVAGGEQLAMGLAPRVLVSVCNR